MSEPSDANLREIWREGLRSTGPVPTPADFDAFDHGITAAIRAVWDAACAADAEEINALEARERAWIAGYYKALDERGALAEQIAAVRALLDSTSDERGITWWEWIGGIDKDAELYAAMRAILLPSPVTPESDEP